MYRTVQTCFWTDPDVRPLKSDAKLLKLYLFTNPHAHVSGIYYLPLQTIAEETGLKIGHIDTLLDTLSHIKRDRDRMIVLVEKMLHHQARGEKAYRAAANHLTTLHNTPLIQDFLNIYPEVRRYCDKVIAIGYPDGASGVGPLKEEEKKGSSLNSLSSIHSLSLITSFSEMEVQKMWNTLDICECVKLSGPIQKRVRLKLREHPERQWWVDLFARVKRSDFLAGRARDWHATLDWVLGPKNLAKIEAGNYDNGKSKSGYQDLKEAFVRS